MSDRPSDILLEDIMEACEKIFSYTQELDFDEFSHNGMVRDAVERNLEIIGEAVNKLTPEAKSAQPHINWVKIVGLRNRLIHGYFAVDKPMLWNTIKVVLPPFYQNILKIAQTRRE